MRKLQKPISILTSITTVLWLSGIVMLAPVSTMAATIVDGDLIRNPSAAGMAQFDIYIAKLVGTKKFKRLILNPQVFESYGHLDKNKDGDKGWNDVINVDQATMDSYTSSDLTREINDTKVYKLTADGDTGTKQWVNMTAADFVAQGYDWDSIYIINSTDRDNYTTGSDITVGGGGGGTSTGTLSVALAADTPASGIVVNSAARYAFTKINLTASNGDVIVDSMTIERGGLGQDAAFSSLAIIQDNVDGDQLGTNKTLNASHQTVVYDDITVTSGTTKSIYLTANMVSSLTNYAGENPTLKLAAMTLKGTATLNATLPISGNSQTLNATITIGTATIADGTDLVTASTQNVGVTNFIVTSIKVTAGAAENVTVKKIVFTQDGSAAAADVENVDLVNASTGEVLTTIAKPSGKILTFTPNLVIDKGKNISFDVRLDIIGGSARTISYDIDQNTDILVKGNTYGYYVVPSYTLTSRPYYNAADTTIGNGSLRVESVSVTPTNIAENKTGIVLGKFKFVGKGEEVKLTSVGWNVYITRGATHYASTTDVTNLTVYKDDGTVVAGPMDPTHDNTSTTISSGSATTTDTIIVPVGEITYTIKGDLSADFTANDTIAIRVKPSLFTARGMITDNSITPTPADWISSSTLTVKATSLTVTVATDPSGQTVVAGTQDFTFAKYVFDATNSGSDVKVTVVKPAVQTTTAAYPDMVSGIELWDGATKILVDSDSTAYGTSGSTVGDSATTTLNLKKDVLIITAGTTKTITVKADIGTGATSGTLKIGAQADCASATDSGGNSFDETCTPNAGQAMTLSAGGTLNMSALTDPAASIVTGGSDGVAVGKFTLQAKYEDINVNYIGLTASSSHLESVCPGTSCIKGTYQDLAIISLYEDGVATALGSVNVAAANATITPSSTMTVPAGKTKSYTLKAKFANLDDQSPAASGETIHLVVSHLSVTGASPGSTSITVNGNNSAFSTFTLYKSKPTVTMLLFDGNNQITANSQVVKLFKFKVTADSAGPIGLYKFTFGVATTTVNLNASTTNPKDASGFYLYMSSSESTDGDLVSRGAANGSDQLATAIMGTVRNDMNIRWTGDSKEQLLLETWFDVANDTSATATEQIIINAGDTKYFTLKGTIKSGHEGTTADNEAVATSFAGDVNVGMTAKKNAGAVDDLDQNDFIWSDLNADQYSTSTATNTLMYYNSFRVSGVDTTTSSAQVITD